MIRDVQPRSLIEDARRVSCPGVVCVAPYQQVHLLGATTPAVSETGQALGLYGVNHGSI